MRAVFETFRGLTALAALLWLPGAAIARQQPSSENADASSKTAQLDSIQAIDRHYRQQLHGLERQRLRELADLAARQNGDDAQKTYRHLLSLAIVSHQYAPARQAAETYLKNPDGDPQTQAMAAFVAAMSEESAGHADRAIEMLNAFLQGPAVSKIDPELLRGLGESFLQDLLIDGQSETAARVARAFADRAPRQIQEHFASRLEQIERIGQPAPAIDTQDIDGQKVSLSQLSKNGKVVLVNFWATWCQPCASETPQLNDLHDRYHDKGLEILGVSVDPRRQGESLDSARSAVRQFLIDYLVPWTAILNGQGDQDFATQYGVSEIPANFLIDQNGKIVRIDLHGRALERAVADLLGEEPPPAEPEETPRQQPASPRR